MKAQVFVIVGPTAVGKTAIALDVVESTGAEIVSLDSMQVYRGMDIGTDKVSPDIRGRIPHHMIDVLDPSQEVTVQWFQAEARGAIEEVSRRGRVPLLVGGSGLYLRAVIDDLRFPPTLPHVRAALEDEAEARGAEALYTRLVELDPAAASKIEPGNARRIVRALEVIEITGRPFSESGAWDVYESIYDAQIVGLQRPRDELFERIDQRVRSMLERGLVDEARRLDAHGMSRTARQALGYRQVLEAAPDATSEDIAIAIVGATKRFARRQESWFRADPRIEWLDAHESGLARRIAERVASRQKGGSVSA